MINMIPHAVPVLADEPDAAFPNPLACRHPDGLVAVGGDLTVTRLLNAYRHGIFPWYEEDGPILWWSPDPRAVLFPGHLHISRRLHRTLRQGRYQVTVNQDFEAVIDGCAAPRNGFSGTWITAEMRTAYLELHTAGHAHSLEIRQQDELVAGIYGVAIGAMFFAESKFHRRRDMSKVALVELMQRLHARGYLMCDCQLWNPHLEHFSLRMLDRDIFLRILHYAIARPSVRFD